MTSLIMKDILQQAANVATSSKSVLIIGEYGSGRSWLAHRIHQIGDRSNKPFITVNCRVIEEYEALKKIFGYENLTRDGVIVNHGSLEQSRGGTVFFENFNNLTEKVQREVIETVQSSQIRRTDSRKTIEIDLPRIICSIEIKPDYVVSQDEFLSDTLLCFDSFIIGQPPLRQRREDIAPLMKTFLNQQFSNRPEASSKKVSPRVIYQCIQYNWPGNVRQLKNAIEHAAITSEHDVIQPEDLPISISSSQSDSNDAENNERGPSFISAEKQLFKGVLTKAGSAEAAAELLGVDRDTFVTKAVRFGLITENPGLEITHYNKN